MTKGKIARHEIQAAISDDGKILEIIYQNEFYDVFIRNLNSWHKPDFGDGLGFSDYSIPLSEVDLILYSDVIDSFIDYYISQNS